MPLREFVCPADGFYLEIYDSRIDPDLIDAPACQTCQEEMELMISIPKIDTSSSFHAFPYRGPDGRRWQIDNLHKLRGVEHSYAQTGHNVRFDAYSAEPNNPDTVDGFGAPYRGPDKPQKGA